MTSNFRDNAIAALKDNSLRAAMRKATDIFISARLNAVADIPVEDWKDRASSVRSRALDNLPVYLDEFAENATKAGAVVHRAKDAQSARETVFHILKDRGVADIVKAKSMVTEEIGLNDYLISRGMSVVETDLG